MKAQNFFNVSQSQHKRLIKKHRDCIDSKQGNYDVHFTRLNYHSAILNRQSKENRILTESEKRKTYNNVISDFY